MLTSLHEELERNRERLEPYLPMHSAWVEALDSTGAASGDQSGFDVFMATRPPFPADASVPFPVLRRSARDAAVSGGALRLIDYDLAAVLSEIYRLQEIAGDNLNRLANGAFTQTSTFDPSAREASIRLLWLTLADIVAAESALLDLYQQHLARVREAVDAGR